MLQTQTQNRPVANIQTIPPISPYREWPINIPPLGVVTIDYLSNTFRAISLSQNTLSIGFVHGQLTTFAGVGLGVVYPTGQAYSSITLMNTDSVNALTGVVALGLVQNIEDTRSATQASVSIKPNTKILTVADVAVAATTTVKVLAANVLTTSVTISNLLANNTTVRVGDINVGAAQGMEIPIGGSATFENTDDIYVFNPSAAAINIGVGSAQA